MIPKSIPKQKDSQFPTMTCGFESLAAESTAHYMVNGIAFNLLVLGSSGIGKSTLINSLFNFDCGDTPDIDGKFKSIELRIKDYRLENNILDLKIKIIETKGYDNNSCKPIVDYLTNRFDTHIKHELHIQDDLKNRITDSRVHCCIYMIPPTGLKAIDIVTLKQLHHKVCIILVIAKSDSLSKDEAHALKLKIRDEILANGIEIYSPNEIQWPLAIAASNEILKPAPNGATNGENRNDNEKTQRARIYPWGTMYIERDSEFALLREFILKTHMLDLIDHTDHVHYDRHRDDVIAKFRKEHKKPPVPPKPTTPMRFAPSIR